MADDTIVSCYNITANIGPVSHLAVGTDDGWAFDHCSVLDCCVRPDDYWLTFVDIYTSHDLVKLLLRTFLITLGVVIAYVCFDFIQCATDVPFIEQFAMLITFQASEEPLLRKWAHLASILRVFGWFHTQFIISSALENGHVAAGFRTKQDCQA